MHEIKVARLRERLSAAGVAGLVLSTSENVAYSSGFESVMDGWRLPEPISAVFIPTDAGAPPRDDPTSPRDAPCVTR